MVYAYLRVSTDAQDTNNQRIGIETKAQMLGLDINKYIIDIGVSGATDPDNRKFGRLLKTVKAGDVIIVSELSRLGRRLFMLFRILETLLNKGVIVYSVKDGYALDNTIQAKILAFVFGMAAEIERDMISQRTKEALAVRRAKGIKLGRPRGSVNKQYKLDGKREQVMDMLARGSTKNQIARYFHVSLPTLYRCIANHK